MAIIGIDLGTTTSEACFMRNGSPEMIRDFSSGNDITPSVVGVDPRSKQVIVGEKAKSLLLQYPDQFVSQVKRKMGSADRLQVGDQDLLPEEISALILKHIKKYAEQYLKEEVDRVVITIPANFDDKAKSATKKAGELAGMTVERLISEPTAAALSYNVNNKENKHVMVYDLGGGTFDVTVLEVNGSTLDIKASNGDPNLGGVDFDESLFGYVCKEFSKQHGVDISDDSAIKNRLLPICEQVKRDLSTSLSSDLSVPAIAVRDGKILNLNMTITRDLFESLIIDKLGRTEKAINAALADARLSPTDIDTVLLVGGSTRIPSVQQLVERIMGQKPLFEIDPDRAVSMGAAIQSSIIEGDSETIIMDVVPLSMGIEVVSDIAGQSVSGLYSEIIKPNSPMLKEFKETFFTVHDNQDSVEVRVFQKNPLNDSLWANDHTFLGSDTLSDIPEAPAGDESIEVTFLYNLNGILDVTAVCPSTANKKKFSLTTAQSVDADPSTVEQLWQNSERAQEVESTIRIAEKRLNELGEHKELEAKIAAIKDALIANNSEDISRLDDEINDLLFELD